MAGTIKDSFLDLERHRQLLEENIESLRQSLRHWQTWEAEYEGLKEEILAADPPPSRTQLVTLIRGYEGDLVNRKEIDQILGPETRNTEQIVNILDRRMDYVEQNVQTIKKQVEVAKNKLAAATIISTPDVRNEEGLPLTEIFEELDEEGNVISSHTTTPGSAKPQLLEVLRKAGVKDLPSVESPSSSTPLPKVHDEEIAGPQVKEVDQQKKAAGPEDKVAKAVKKGVTFAEDTKMSPDLEKSRTAKRVEEIMKAAKRSAETASEPPLIPPDESPEDAELRREMLQYGMSEVGAVVAELSLEDGSDWSDGDYDDELSTDDEDQFGRSIGSIVDDDLRQRMLELEERLGARVIENIGNNTTESITVREGIGRVTIGGQDSIPANKMDDKSTRETSGSPASNNTKKEVRFSEDLDISPAPSQPRLPPVTSKSTASPIGDVVERTGPANSANATPKKKISRFKSDQGTSPRILNGPHSTHTSGPSFPLQPLKPSKPKPFSQPIEFPHSEERIRAVPTGPEGKTVASTIIERDVALDASAAEPDELDANLLHQEVATEYHRMRNRMIQRQGGFLKEEESEIIPFTEEEGGPKKMSRFKAARLARS